jgi:hypothetical protein
LNPQPSDPKATISISATVETVAEIRLDGDPESTSTGAPTDDERDIRRGESAREPYRVRPEDPVLTP